MYLHFAFSVVQEFLFSILFTYPFIVFFLYKTVRKIGVVNISVFLFVNVKRRTEDSELVLNIHTYVHTYTHTYVHTYIHTYIHIYTYIITEVNLLVTSLQVQSCFIAGVLKYLKRSVSRFCFLLQLIVTYVTY